MFFVKKWTVSPTCAYYKQRVLVALFLYQDPVSSILVPYDTVHLSCTYRSRFDLLGIRDMRKLLSDHFALRARLLRSSTCLHTRYFREKIAFPLRLSPAKERSRAGAKFQTLKALEPVPPKLKRPPRPLYMSPDSIRLIDKIAAFLRNPCHNRNVARGLTRSVCQSLMAYSRRQAEESATDIRSCMETSMGGADPRWEYAILKQWYQHASARAPNPS